MGELTSMETEDLWMERNSCYAILNGELFNVPPVRNFGYLKEFESGDEADVDAWNMAVEYVKRAGNGWKVTAPGVLVRDPDIAAAAAKLEEDELRSASKL